MFHGANQVTKPCCTEQHRNFLFWCLESFPNWRKLAGNSDSAVPEKTTNQPTYFFLCFWEFQSTYCDYTLKSDLQSRRNPDDQLLSPRLAKAARDSYVVNPPVSASAGGPFSEVPQAAVRNPAALFSLRRELGASPSHLLSCRLEAADQGWLVPNSKIIIEELFI